MIHIDLYNALQQENNNFFMRYRKHFLNLLFSEKIFIGLYYFLCVIIFLLILLLLLLIIIVIIIIFLLILITKFTICTLIFPLSIHTNLLR